MKSTTYYLLRLYCVFFIFSAIATTSIVAQERGSETTFTLEQTLRLAEQNNLDIRNAETNLQTAKAGVTRAFGSFLPSVSFDMGYNRRLNSDPTTININGQIIPNPNPTPPNSYSMSLGANLPLFNGFAREANYSQAEANLTATDNSIQHERRRVLHSVRKQYLNILLSDQVVNIRHEDLVLAQKELERITAQYEVGRVPIANVYAQEADMGSKELALVQAENDVNLSKSIILTTLGMNPGEKASFLSTGIPDSITTADMAQFRSEIGNFQAALNKAYDNRLDYRATQYRIEAAESNITVSRSGYFPSLMASGGWNWGHTELSNFGEFGRTAVGLRLSIPIFENFQTNYQMESAQVALDQQEIAKRQLEQAIASEVQQALFTLDAAEKQLEITVRALKSAEQNFNSASERFRVGAANILDYTTANTQYTNARINRATAVYNYIAARYQVEYATGVLDR